MRNVCSIIFPVILLLIILSVADCGNNTPKVTPSPAISSPVASSSAQPVKVELLIIPGKSAGPIQLGENIDALESRIGKGQIVPGESFQIFSFQKLMIDVCVQKDTIVMVLVRNPKYHTREGICVGGKVTPVIRTFGRKYEYESVKSPEVDYIIQYWEKGISFSVKNDQIVKIKIFNQKLTIDLMRA